jgi:hypothetical protein
MQSTAVGSRRRATHLNSWLREARNEERAYSCRFLAVKSVATHTTSDTSPLGPNLVVCCCYYSVCAVCAVCAVNAVFVMCDNNGGGV